MSRLHEGTQNDERQKWEFWNDLEKPSAWFSDGGRRQSYLLNTRAYNNIRCLLRIRKFIRARHQLFRDSDQKPTSPNDGIISALWPRFSCLQGTYHMPCDSYWSSIDNIVHYCPNKGMQYRSKTYTNIWTRLFASAFVDERVFSEVRRNASVVVFVCWWFFRTNRETIIIPGLSAQSETTGFLFCFVKRVRS